ncbi:MAG: sigma-70 family RNA polymerase sigma factor [Anaerolineae bacterium]|nr:sigma-70 family RNA polymerase sigma factor [Gemmatimonadaceae bacterium]
MSDEELLRRMHNGDADSLGRLYDRWSPLLFPLVVHLLTDPDEAEDVVQETFWQAWRHADRYDAARSDVAGWLFVIARSKALMRLRARRRRREEPLPSADAPELVAPLADPAVNAELAGRRAIVLAALAGLPPEQRHTVDLAYFHGMTQQEIAERTGQPLGTVKGRIRLALEKLRQPLAALAEGGL